MIRTLHANHRTIAERSLCTFRSTFAHTVRRYAHSVTDVCAECMGNLRRTTISRVRRRFGYLKGLKHYEI
jgi:hypothetical protein